MIHGEKLNLHGRRSVSASCKSLELECHADDDVRKMCLFRNFKKLSELSITRVLLSIIEHLKCMRYTMEIWDKLGSEKKTCTWLRGRIGKRIMEWHRARDLAPRGITWNRVSVRILHSRYPKAKTGKVLAVPAILCRARGKEAVRSRHGHFSPKLLGSPPGGGGLAPDEGQKKHFSLKLPFSDRETGLGPDVGQNGQFLYEILSTITCLE